jgi:hypothetical protein
MPLVDGQQDRIHARQKLAGTPVWKEHGLTFDGTDSRAVHIDVNHQFIIGDADIEGQAFNGQRDVDGVPAGLPQEQVLPLLKPKQRHGFEGDRIRRLSKDDRIVRLNISELGRKGTGEHHVVAKLGASPRSDSQVLVVDVVQQDSVGHVGLAGLGTLEV